MCELRNAHAEAWEQLMSDDLRKKAIKFAAIGMAQTPNTDDDQLALLFRMLAAGGCVAIRALRECVLLTASELTIREEQKALFERSKG